MGAILLGFLLSLLCLCSFVDATHFAYGSNYWNLIPNPSPYAPVGLVGTPTSARTYQIVNIFGYRRSFGWNPSNPSVGQVVQPGDLKFFPMGAYTGGSLETQNVLLTVRTLFLTDDWFMGDFNTTFGTGPEDPKYYASNWRSYFNGCCRLSSIRNANNDVDWTITGILNRYSTRSPQAQGLPRVYVQQFYPLQYQVPFIVGSAGAVVISLGQPVDSTLVAQIPMDPPPRNTSFKFDKLTGTCFWTPQVTGLYAISFFVEEDCPASQGRACANLNISGTGASSGAGATPADCCSRIPLDFIFQVDPGCNGEVNCVEPPYFIAPFPEKTTTPAERVWYFYRGVEGTFQVCATNDNSNQTTSIDFGVKPPTSSLTLLYQRQTTCYQFKWAPGAADTDTFLCAQATSFPGYRGVPLKSQGNYCIKLVILDSNTLTISGIVRDFHYYHPNFNRSYADCVWCSPARANWVETNLDGNHKPVYKIGSTTVSTWPSGLSFPANTTQGFYDWWTTDLVNQPPRNVQVVVPLIFSAGTSINQAIFTFLSSAFFPIDNQGFGNEARDHNYFYTYEMNMYITYLSAADGGGVDQILRVAAADDLWVFIDNVLPTNWNLHGIKPNNNATGTPYEISVNMSSLRGSNGLPLVSQETYRCDIFYANRYSTPYLVLETANNSLCSQLSSGMYAFNWTSFGVVPLVNGDTTLPANINPNGLVYYAPPSGPFPIIADVTRPSGATVKGLKLFDQLALGPEKVCFATPLKGLHGFIATFTWFVRNPTFKVLDGFAFVLDSYSQNVRGGGGANLGYGGTQKTFAVEFDMLQSAVFSDYNFQTCCGAYPYWNTTYPPGQWPSSVKPYGQVAYHANFASSGGNYGPNLADESSQGSLLLSGSSGGRIALDFKNGSEYRTKVVYNPAKDDGSLSPQPGWFWVYMNTQIEPIVGTQVDGVLLRNMLGGDTSFCFTASGQYDGTSNPSGYGADIWLLDYSVLIVPTDPKSTSIVSAGIVGQPVVVGATSPINPVIAGQTAQVTVRARDACDNPITVGGELKEFNCTVSKATCPGAPIPCTGVDNLDGTYTFSYTPTIAANNYALSITFAANNYTYAIKSSPFLFSVIAAPASVIMSKAVFGQLPELLSNGGNDPFNGVLQSEGVWAARFSTSGRVVAYKMFDFNNATFDTYNGGGTGGANLNTFLAGAQAGEFVAIAVSGSQILPSQISAAQASVSALGGTQFASILPGIAYVFIGRKGGPSPTCTPSCEVRTNGRAFASARGTDTSISSFTRYFNITASSANDECGPYAVLNSIFDDIRVPAGSTNQFTIQARDIYGNLNPTTLIDASFSPDLTPATGGSLVPSFSFPQTGYFYYPFYSTKAGNYFVYTSLDASPGNINYGQGPPYGPYPVKIDPGLANRTNSLCQGAVLTSTVAGSWATVQLVLNDRWNNPITFQNPYDTVTASLVFANNNSFVLPLNLSWQDGAACQKCVLYGSFFPTVASTPGTSFQINLNVNGEIAPCGTPDIVPGPLSPANCSFDLSAVAPNPSIAGSTASFVIQARDRYGNNRRTPNSPYDTFVISYNPSVNGASLQYAGNGQYLATLIPVTEGNNSVTVNVSSTGLGDVKTIGNQTVGTQALRVLPGPSGVPSTYAGVAANMNVTAGTLNTFTVVSRDQFSNLRDNQPYGISVANSADYYFRFFEPAKQIDGLISHDTTATPLFTASGTFTVRYNATLIGDYRLTIQTVPGGIPITASPVFPIHVVPACTYPNFTLFSGPGLGGGVQATNVNFSLTARDIFTNIQDDYFDQQNYNLTIVSTTTTIGSIANGPTAGTYVAVYEVPANTQQTPLSYSIIVCHNGRNGTSTTQSCFPSWCTTFLGYAINTNKNFNGSITVANGTAGSQSNWVIEDLDINGVPPTTEFVASWTVTVLRTNPADGASAAPAVQVSCNKGGGTSCIQSPRAFSNVSFTPTINIGDFRVRVFAYGVETEQSKLGVSVTIFPGPVYPPNCQVYGLSATSQAGIPGSFSVALKDQWFHNITSGNQTVKANATLASPSALVPLSGMWSSSTQQFSFNYNLSLTGVWPVSIWESSSFVDPNTLGQTIGGGLTITVTPGPASCLTSYVKGVILSQNGSFGTAGSQSSFTVVPLDAYGNPVTDPLTMATFADNSNNATFIQIVQNSPIPPAIEIGVLYTPIKIHASGFNTLSVQIGGCDVNGMVPVGTDPVPQTSPLNVTILPAAIFPPGCTVVTSSPQIVAGSSLNMTLALKDMYGNNWFSDAGSQLTGFVNIPGTGQQVGTIVIPKGSGTYQFYLSGQSTHLASHWNGVSYDSDYSWSVSALGTPITGTTLDLINVPTTRVIADVTSPPHTLAPTLIPMKSSVPQTYSVTLQDQYGNRKYLGADTDTIQFLWIEGTIDCTPGETIPPSTSMALSTTNVTALGQGVFNVTIIGSTIGKYTLNLTVTPFGGGLGWYGAPNCNPTSKLVQEVEPGEASPPNSYWTIPRKVFSAGDMVPIFLQVRDKSNNNIGRRGTLLAFKDTLVPIDSTVNHAPFPPFPATGSDTWTLNSTWSLKTYGPDYVKPDFVASPPSLPIFPGQAPTLGSQLDYGNSSYLFTLTLYKAGLNQPLVLSMVNESGSWVAVPWPSELALNAAVDVNPGPPRQFSPTTAQVVANLSGTATAAIPASFVLTAYDNYGNVLTNNAATFDVVMQHQQNGYTVKVTASPGPSPGQTMFSFTSAWGGAFTVLIVMKPGDNTANIISPAATLTIAHATCEYDNPGKPYRCPDRTCVAQYSDCSSLGADTCASQGMMTCFNSPQCVTSVESCPCPSGESRCPLGNCASSCPSAPTVCSTGQVLCDTNGPCRLTTADCPSLTVCAPGYVLCPSGISCGRNASDCSLGTPVCQQGLFACPSGSCVSSLQDCPTPVSCGAGYVLCLSDGSCQVDRNHCPDQYPCYAPNTFRCPGTGLCTETLNQCPSLITCPSGWVKCQDQTCAPTVGSCPAPLPCGLDQVVCPDGSCENNMLYCPALITCPTLKPVLCWDKSCVQYISECNLPQSCPNVTCPGGVCSLSFGLCPTGTTCPVDYPVLCADGSCQNSSSFCTLIPACPINQPVRCPDGQSCRGSLTDCPTIVSCPSVLVKCPDGTCALALDQCGAVVNCPDDLLRCPGGECVAGTTALCPTHETCLQGFAKCLDGTCRTLCPTSYQTCPEGQITCPQAAAGVQCADSLTLCPQQPTCPPLLPVRCSDASCVTTVTNCPVPPTTFPNNKIPCGDGTWASDISSCPTPITCPESTPAKCTDNTCRVTAADCPETKLCTSLFPYLCSTGACVAVPWDSACTSSSSPCSSDAPIACAPYESGVCVNNSDLCSATPLNCTGNTCTICGPAQTYCRSGVCVTDPLSCPLVSSLSCDTAFPFLCLDGLCAKSSSECNNPATGCPAATPNRCPQTGQCVVSIANEAECPTNGTQCASGVFCDDGSCLPLGQVKASYCPGPNGCGGVPNPGKTARCYDGTCVADFSDCTSSYSPLGSFPAMCPAAAPYKCQDGYCAKSSVACPPQMVDLKCAGNTSFQCAIGTCVASSIQCPSVNPYCDAGKTRCNDGICRVLDNCPLYSSCSNGTRCGNGLCAPDITYCEINPFNGCPANTIKCNQTGECVLPTVGCTVLPTSSGCAVTIPIKCYSGECVANLADCLLPNNCPSTLPIRCPDGTCTSTQCTGTSDCPSSTPVRCADSSCAAAAKDCTSINGCPVSTPFRCADGSCARYPSSTAQPESCKATVTCTGQQTLCADGSCVDQISLCKPLFCTAGQQYCNFDCYAPSSCNSNSSTCPIASPVLCPNGACVGQTSMCGTSPTGGPVNQMCTSTQQQCQDGRCVNELSVCVTQAQLIADGSSLAPSSPTNANLACASGFTMCPNGVCVPKGREYACLIIPACPIKQYRWWNGKCMNTTSGKPTEINCNVDLIRCEDGYCREKKLGYDGCGLSRPYHCKNRECAINPDGCDAAARGNPLDFPAANNGAYRRLLADPPAACEPGPLECYAQIHAALIDATVDVTTTQKIDVALNSGLVVVGSLKIPSGAFALKNGGTATTISIRPVPASRMRYAVNEIVPSRRQAYGSFFPFSNTVLSPAFECVLGPDVVPRFTINVTYTAWIDQVSFIQSNYKDVCLARLVELQGFSTWECLINDRSLRNSTSVYYVHKDGDPNQQVQSVFDSCQPSSAPGVISPYNGSVYAFIWSPVPDEPQSPEGLDVVQRNIVWIILGILLGLAVLVMLAYCAFRLFRYREKYHTEREEADRLQEEVENMRQFGGDSGNKDDQVAMTANPLAVQLKDVQARYNEEELKLQKAEASLRKQEGDIRAQHIDNMRDNRNKLAQELEKLKQQLAEAQAASAPKPTFEETDSAPTYTGDEPVREEFDTGSSTVAPKRGKKDL